MFLRSVGLAIMLAPLTLVGANAFDMSRFGDSAPVATGFDMGRFGDAPVVKPSTTNFDPGRFGDPVTTAGGIQPTPVKTITIKDPVTTGSTKESGSAVGSQASDTASNPGKLKDDTVTKDEAAANADKELTSEEKAELDTYSKKCGTAKGQANAGELAKDDAAIREGIKNSGMQDTQSCVDASKAVATACSKGDATGAKAAAAKVKSNCLPYYDKYMDMAPTSDVGVDTSAVSQNPTEALKNVLANNPISSMLGGASSATNPFQQMMLSMIAQQLMGGGASGGAANSDGTVTDSSGNTVACVASTTAAYQNPKGGYFNGMYCPAGTLPVTIGTGSNSGGNGSSDDEVVVEPPKCDSVKETTVSTKTTVEKDAAGKDVAVVTKVTTHTCANKNIEVKTEISKTAADGTKVDTQQVTVKVPQ